MTCKVKIRARALAGNLEAALTWRDEGARAQVLAAFLPVAPDPATLRSARRVVAEHLPNKLSADEHERVRWLCAAETLLAPPILDHDTLAAIAGYIIEVCQEWRWM